MTVLAANQMEEGKKEALSHLRRCPPPAAVSVGGRSSPAGRTGCVSSSPSASPCSTGCAPETEKCFDCSLTNCSDANDLLKVHVGGGVDSICLKYCALGLWSCIMKNA